jgi:hypothetical protein
VGHKRGRHRHKRAPAIQYRPGVCEILTPALIFFLRLLIVEAETVLRWRRNGWAALGDIGHLVADEVAAQGLSSEGFCD